MSDIFTVVQDAMDAHNSGGFRCCVTAVVDALEAVGINDESIQPEVDTKTEKVEYLLWVY